MVQRGEAEEFHLFVKGVELDLQKTTRENGCIMRIITIDNFVMELYKVGSHERQKGEKKKCVRCPSCMRQICLLALVSLLCSFNLFLLKALGITCKRLYGNLSLIIT